MDNIKAMSKNKSVIVISHRLANVVPADKESGSHAYLMERKGEYAELFNAQKQLEEGYKSGKASAEVVA